MRLDHWKGGRAVIILLAIVASLFGFSGTAFAATTCAVGSGAYPTINSATTNNGCDIVTIPAGTYTEQVTINHPVTIIGAGQGQTIIKHPAPGAGTQQDQGADFVVLFFYSDVVMHDLTIDGGSYSCKASKTCPANMNYGLEFSAGNENVYNVTCQNMGAIGQNHDGSCVGLNTIETYQKQDQRITLQHDTFNTFTHTALEARDDALAYGSYVNIYFTDNVVTASGAGQYGFYNMPHQSKLQHNSFTGFTSADPAGTAVQNLTGGIAIEAGFDTHENYDTQELTNNTFTGNDVAMLFKGSDNPSEIYNNTFSNNGIDLAYVNDANGGENIIGQPVVQQVYNNTIGPTNQVAAVADSGTAILICSDSIDDFTGNTISNSAIYGVKICANSYQNQLTNNTITGSGTGDILDQTTGTWTNGTLTRYQQNNCATSAPAGLCNTGVYTPAGIAPPAGANCPANWNCADIGGPQPAGGESLVNGVWTIGGGGADIWNTADQFHYDWQALPGDGTLSARITGQTATNQDAKAGVMIRQSTDPGAVYYAAMMSPQSGKVDQPIFSQALPPTVKESVVQIQFRPGQGQASQQISFQIGSAPSYISVTRVGQTFTTSFSFDGVHWTPVINSGVTLNAANGAMLAGLAVTSHVQGTEGVAVFDHVASTLTTPPPPPPPPPTACTTGWTCQDIGTVAQAGSSTLSNGVWTINGAGSDIWGNADQFQYAYQPVAADGSVSAHILSQTNTSDYAKAGVMFRQSNDPTAAFYGIFVSPAHGLLVQYRTAAGAGAQQAATLAGTVPTFVKVTRTGQSYSAFTSPEGQTWTLVPGSTVTLTTAGQVLAGLAVTAHNGGAVSTATFDTVMFTTPAPPPPSNCPTGWTCQDIGAPGLAGSSALANGIWTINGGGSDIWGNADQFQYVYQTLAGDGTISAHVTGQTNTSVYAKAGVMIRQSIDPAAAFYGIFVTPVNGILVQYRTAAGANAQQSAVQPGTVPAYVKVGRTGQSYSAYTSPDGLAWTLVPGSTVTLTTAGGTLAGLAVTAHNGAAISTATLDTVAISTTAPPPPTATCATGWICQDIGNVAQAGSSTLTNGVWTINGAGSDIWGNADQFQYAYQTLAADGTVSAHVTSQTNTSDYAKAGVMVRQSTDPAAAFYGIFVSPAHGLLVQYRTAAGANAQQAATLAGTVPAYMRVVRTGQSYSAFTSPDGVAWTLVPGSTVTLTTAGQVLAGLAVTAHNGGQISIAAFDTVSVGAAAPPAPTPTPPAPTAQCATGWTCQDIGVAGPVLAGSSTLVNGVWTVNGAGEDIWLATDQFQYAYKPLAGDGTLSAHVTSQTNTSDYAKGGIMVRQSAAANSAFYGIFVTPAHGLLIQYRSATGAAAQEAVAIPGAVPVYIRVARVGQSYSAYTSADGQTWTLVAGSTVTIAPPAGSTTSGVLIGLAVTAHNGAALSAVTFDTVN